MYSILITRLDAYQKLIEVLKELCQTGAVSILTNQEQKFWQYGKIGVHKTKPRKDCRGMAVFQGSYSGRKVDVKVVSEDVKAALKEVRILITQDQHESIVRLFTAEQHKTKVYIAMEFCKCSLWDAIKSKMEKLNLKHVLMKCTEGIAHLHSQQIVHSNLNPKNILITTLGQVKISDFASCKKLDSSDISDNYHPEFRNDWMAPEVLVLYTDDGYKSPAPGDVVNYSTNVYFV